MTEKVATPVASDAPGPPRSRHFEWFDSMRAIAVLGVILIHVGASSGANRIAWYGVATSQGRLGVRIFFMISAFLLYRPWAMAHLHGSAEPRLAVYARRRALRILPAYWLALTFLTFWPGLPKVWSEDWWIYYGILQAYWPAHLFSGLAVAWSLTIEVTFYLVLPFLAMALGLLGYRAEPRTRLRRQLWALAFLGLMAEAFRLYAFSIGKIGWNFTLASMFLPFALGMMLAISSAWLGTDERRWGWTRFVCDHSGVIWLGAAVLFTGLCFTPVFMRAGVGKHTLWTWTFEQLGYVAISGLLLLPAVFGERNGGWPRRILASRFLGFMGLVSYGVFLWHQPLLRWMNQAGWKSWIPDYPFLSLLIPCMIASLFAGWASYRFVELPAMRLRGGSVERIG